MATPGREIDPETGQFTSAYISNAVRLRGIPPIADGIMNYVPPPGNGNTAVGFLEELKKIPWPVWGVMGIIIIALFLGPKE